MTVAECEHRNLVLPIVTIRSWQHHGVVFCGDCNYPVRTGPDWMWGFTDDFIGRLDDDGGRIAGD